MLGGTLVASSGLLKWKGAATDQVRCQAPCSADFSSPHQAMIAFTDFAPLSTMRTGRLVDVSFSLAGLIPINSHTVAMKSMHVTLPSTTDPPSLSVAP